MTLIRKLLRSTILNQRYYSRIDVAHIFISGTVGDWTQNAKLELENVTHRDILQTSLREMGDTSDENVGKNVDKNVDRDANPELSSVLKNYIVWNWFEENCYQEVGSPDGCVPTRAVRVFPWIPDKADFVMKLDPDILIHPFRFEDFILRKKLLLTMWTPNFGPSENA